MAEIEKAYDYIKGRYTGNCYLPDLYSLAKTHKLFKLVRIFDPARADQLGLITAENVRALCAEIRCTAFKQLEGQMIRELDEYVARAKDIVIPRKNMHEYTERMLRFWRGVAAELPGWHIAARIVFSFKPTSASCERVFALLENMFGKDRDRSLADYIALSVMLAYNDRPVG